MVQLTIMSYNIRHMNHMFTENRVKDDEVNRAQSIASVIKAIHPHLLGICEAANSPEEHQYFIENYLPDSGYQVAMGVSRGRQNLVYYYRAPLILSTIDDAFDYYTPWQVDIDSDGVKEEFRWERKPLEAVFCIGNDGPDFRVILVHTKSKGVFTVTDLHHYQKLAMGNRKRLVAQAQRLRQRMDALLAEDSRQPLIVMGDMNDGPGLDAFEQLLGYSFVETVMGSVFQPDKIFRNTLWWMTQQKKTRDELWTADFPDPIVSAPFGMRHRVWIDHILVSPDMLKTDNPLRLVKQSGTVAPKTKAARDASDHFPIYCQIEAEE